ncbi:hypothetical protein HDU83_001247 [Entophlyctis luteolus]|nr:hypothetical protein HDU83_001247 [Entophlyctis luteolus]
MNPQPTAAGGDNAAAEPSVAFAGAATALAANFSVGSIGSVHGYTFRDPALLNAALLHPSVPGVPRHAFQRLELLGDAVLKLVATELLLANYPQEDESTITKRIDRLVNAEAAESMAKHVRLHEMLLTGSRTRLDNSSIYADAFEALLGAIYMDTGFSLDVPRNWIESMAHLETFESNFDPKGRLQRVAKVPLKYEKVSETGTASDKMFVMRVEFQGLAGYGAGKRKRIAEANAAADLLTLLDADIGRAYVGDPNELAGPVSECSEFLANSGNSSTDEQEEPSESPTSDAVAKLQPPATIPVRNETDDEYALADEAVSARAGARAD